MMRLSLLIPLVTVVLATAAAASEPKVGPAHGSLVIHGGGRLGVETVAEFIRLAGGVDANFVVIPTAEPGEDWGDNYVDHFFLTRAGAKHVTVVHTRDRAVADRAAFVEPLTKASAVWIDGGRQWRLADAYLGTRTLTEIRNVLARGGVVGGSSAGATIQGSYLVRGAPEGNTIMMAKGHEEGFALVRDCAIDQHTITRHREDDMQAVIEAHPGLLGFGIDENTALIVQGDRARVIGASKVAVTDRAYSAGADGHRYFFLNSGDVLDLVTRRPVTSVK